jgi:two-component system, OmpR family, response regulator
MSRRKIQSVLYVDDDAHICALVQATLCSVAGLNVHTAGSGEQAIDLAYQLRPDLVLMDVMMPGLDGPSTLKCMRERALLADIPVIFLTAKVLPPEVAHLLRLGAIGVIGKPFKPLELCDDLFAIWNNSDVKRGMESGLAGHSQVLTQVSTLTDGFLQRTRGDVIRLRAIIERARQSDRSVLKDAQHIAHSIHGAGAMFGFPEVSAAGGAIERLVEGIMASAVAPGSTGDQTVLQQLSECMAQLAVKVASAGQPPRSNAEMIQVPRKCR